MSSSQSRLWTNATIITMGEACRVIEDGAILVKDGKITALGAASQIAAEGAIVESLGGRVVMPGKINAHDHLYSAFARGIALKDEPPRNFLQILERLWWRLDAALTAEDVYYSGMLGFMEAVRSGTTTIVDHHASPGAIEGSLDQLARASLEVGLRGCFCYEVTDRHGESGARAGIEENLRFLQRCRQERNGKLAAAFGLHASITVGPKTLAECLERSQSDDIFHVHVAEDGCDVEDAHQKYSQGPLQRLLAEGLSQRPTLAAHCIHLDEGEVDLLAQNQVTVLHNPRSNMNNAVGCAPVGLFLRKGIAVCGGTDGMSQDPSEDWRTVALIHKHQSNDCQAFSWGDFYQVGYLNNARLAERFFGQPIGALEVGAAADLMVVDYDPPTPLTSDNFLGHLLFGLGTAPVYATVVAGETVFRDGKVLGVDEKEVRARCRELSAKLWERW